MFGLGFTWVAPHQILRWYSACHCMFTKREGSYATGPSILRRHGIVLDLMAF